MGATSMIMAGCSVGAIGGAATPSPSATHSSATVAKMSLSAAPSAFTTAATKATYYRLVQYPGAGFGGFYAQIAAAKKTIHMEMYELADTAAEHDLAAAAARGVQVEVLLDKDFSGASVNASAYSYLQAHNVAVKWAPAGYIFHIKATTFDGTTSDISTANLTPKYYETSRDAEIIDTDPAQVTAIEATFAHDFDEAPEGAPALQTMQGPGLVWSPNTGSSTAETAVVNQIEAAKHSVEFTSEELSDADVYNALAADAERGVTCEIVMTNSSEWKTGFAKDKDAGCKVHVLADSKSALYIHEKIVLDDQGTGSESLLIGSQNASRYSLTRNRELAIELTNAHGGQTIIAAVAKTFASDYAMATAWSSASGSSRPTSTGSSTGGGATTTSGCHPTTESDHCYTAGEFCSGVDHGMTGVAKDGESIVCEDHDGWRWEAA